MDNIKRFENQPIRTAWDEEKEEWYFSVSDVVEILSESKDVKQYIKKMRSRDPELNSKWGTICTPVRMMTADGKNRKINAADTEGILRIIQSIPSKKAEPFKMWLAQVGRERIEEIIDPELTIERALETYAKKGYPADWIKVLYLRITEFYKKWNGSKIQNWAMVRNQLVTNDKIKARIEKYEHMI